MSQVRPYIMDMGSTNGTYLNNERLDSERYYELLNKVLEPGVLLLQRMRQNCHRLQQIRPASQELVSSLPYMWPLKSQHSMQGKCFQLRLAMTEPSTCDLQDLIRFGNSSREYVLLHEGALQEG